MNRNFDQKTLPTLDFANLPEIMRTCSESIDGEYCRINECD